MTALGFPVGFQDVVAIFKPPTPSNADSTISILQVPTVSAAVHI